MRGRKNSLTPKPSSTKQLKKPQQQKNAGESVVKSLKSHPAFSKPKELKKDLKQLKKSPSKGGKTLSQKLVVKMTFSSLKTKSHEEQNEASLESSPAILEVRKQKKAKNVKDKLKTKLKISSDDPPVKKRKLSIDKTKKDAKKVKNSESVEKKKKERKLSVDRSARTDRGNSQDSGLEVSKRIERKHSKDKTLQRSKSVDVRVNIERLKSADKVPGETSRRKSADSKSDKPKHRKTETLSKELQVMQNIKANSRSARLRKLQDDLKESAVMEESSDEDISDVVIPAKYDPCVADDDEQGKIVTARQN